ncbi:MAG TPA: flagellar hook protein FlgE [Granulicella sp.]|jgi:flagellar hook protein FlgE|nr:flagellar hook protein FlgE [Granulicella sp.]
MPSFSIALSGLSADSVALNTIGNNLANLNTTAFKQQSTEFENLFYQQIGVNGSGDALQVGAGTKVASTGTDYSQGSIDPTTDSSDMALSGDGYFVVNEGGVNELTRAGNFQLDANGSLITSDGAGVMGYAATNGVIGSNSALTALQLPVGTTEAAQATQNFSVTANLNAGASIGTPFTTPVTLYDSLGQQHIATVSFTKTASNTWSYSVTLPAGDATGTPTNNTGTLTFDSSGNLLTPASNITGVTFPTLTDGAADLNLNFNLYGSNGAPTVTQTAAASQQNANAQDGFASGIYNGFTVDSSGVISATFSNGQTESVGQVAVATVANNEGLTVVGDNNFMTTAASGVATIGVAGTGSRGTITDSALELSNVDISTEFADLIVAQRAFEANSKTVTTFDTVTQDTIAMIR